MPITPFGAEFSIAVSSGSNTPEPRLTTLIDGRVVATWFDIGSNGGDIRHRLFDSSGASASAELSTAASTAGQQTAPAVAALANGGWVVVWQDFGGDAQGDVRYRVFDPAGNAVATGLATDGEQSGNRQADPAVTGLPDGRFVIAWTDRNGTNSNRPEGTDAVVGRAFTAQGQPDGGIVRLSGPNGSGIATELDTRAPGGFGPVLVGIWDDNALDGLYSFGGNSLPTEDADTDNGALGDETTSEAARSPDIAMTPSGVVSVWEQGGIIYTQVDNLFGGPSQVMAVSTSGFAQGVPRVEALPFGGHVIVWEEFRNPAGSFTSFDIFAQVYDAAGNPEGAAVNLTPGQTGAEFDPEVTGLIDGRFMVSWGSQGALGDVIGRIYDPRTAGILFEGGTAGEQVWGANLAGSGDRIFGNGGSDRLWGQAGADRLDGGAGNDSMFGGLGNDVYVVDSAGDVVGGEAAFGAGGGIDTVITGVDFTAPVNVEIIRAQPGIAGIDLTGNDAPGTLVGNDLANRLEGRGGNDQVNGNGGADTLVGGEGADTLVGGAGADHFVFTSVSNSRAGATNRDTINGFTRSPGDQDVIDLSAIDANTLTAGVNDAFTFIGSAAYSATGSAGQLRLVGLGAANAVIVEADINGDRVGDFQIFINLQQTMVAGDFLL